MIADAYDAMIDWPKRLAHEAPFYRRWFERAGANRVLDVACGSGRHAAMFHEWGLEVEAADASEAMIQQARDRQGEPAGLRWVVRRFDEPTASEATFDVAICVGNSLALADDQATAARGVRAMFHAIRPGGLVIIQLMNLWRLPEGPVVWQKCRRAAISGSDAMVIKGVHRCGAGGYVDLVVAPLDGTAAFVSESAPLLGIEADALVAMARDAGAQQTHVFGGYHDEPYDRASSIDLILVAAYCEAASE